MVIARTAARGSTGMVQDKALTHRARRAVRGSTGWEQEDPVKHPARSVHRARARLLRALLVPLALATQGTRATPVSRGHMRDSAQRACQESTIKLLEMATAADARLTRARLLRVQL